MLKGTDEKQQLHCAQEFMSVISIAQTKNNNYIARREFMSVISIAHLSLSELIQPRGMPIALIPRSEDLNRRPSPPPPPHRWKSTAPDVEFLHTE